jgi:hypothetical protein
MINFFYSHNRFLVPTHHDQALVFRWALCYPNKVQARLFDHSVWTTLEQPCLKHVWTMQLECVQTVTSVATVQLELKFELRKKVALPIDSRLPRCIARWPRHSDSGLEGRRDVPADMACNKVFWVLDLTSNLFLFEPQRCLNNSIVWTCDEVY